jgi:hypothetical protein
MMADQGRWKELLEKAKSGDLCKHELDQVVASIKDPATKADPYTLLHIIGRAMDTSHEDLVVSYLECPEDPMLSRLALQILCDYWGLMSKYISYVRKFLSGVEWDVEDDVRQIAASIAGEFVRTTTWDRDLFRALLDIATNEDDLPEMRVTAIVSLSRALGYGWDDIPSITSKTNPDDEWYRNMLDQAFRMFLS